MTTRVGGLNGNLILRDQDIGALGMSILNAGVISGLQVTTNSVGTGRALILCTRTSVTPNEVFMVHAEVTAAETIDTSGTKKVWLEVDSNVVNNGTLAPSMNGVGTAKINTGASYPASNYIPLASISSGVITDERVFIALKSIKVDGLLTLKSADIATAGSMDLSGQPNILRFTGSSTITSLGTVPAGTEFTVTIVDAPLLTYNAGSFILPGAANLQAAPGDVAKFVSLGSGNWRCTSYTKANGQPVVAPTPVVSQMVKTNTAGQALLALQGYRPGINGSWDYSISSLSAYTFGTTETTILTTTWFSAQTINSISINAYSTGGTATLSMKLYNGATLLGTASVSGVDTGDKTLTFTFSGGVAIADGVTVTVKMVSTTTNGYVNLNGGITVNSTEDTTKKYKVCHLSFIKSKGFEGVTTAAVAINASFTGVVSGVVSGLTSLTPGEQIFVNHNGILSRYSGNAIIEVGKATSSTEAIIDPSFYAFYKIIAGTTITCTDDRRVKTTNSTTYTQLLTFNVKYDGVYTISMTGVNVTTGYLRIYVNGLAVGTERTFTTQTTWSEDITLSSGDTLEVYGKTSNATYATTLTPTGTSFTIKCAKQEKSLEFCNGFSTI